MIVLLALSAIVFSIIFAGIMFHSFCVSLMLVVIWVIYFVGLYVQDILLRRSKNET